MKIYARLRFIVTSLISKFWKYQTLRLLAINNNLSYYYRYADCQKIICTPQKRVSRVRIVNKFQSMLVLKNSIAHFCMYRIPYLADEFVVHSIVKFMIYSMINLNLPQCTQCTLFSANKDHVILCTNWDQLFPLNTKFLLYTVDIFSLSQII